MGSVVVDLKAAGLTHAPGKSDKCDGQHEVDEEFLTDADITDAVLADGLEKVLQALHELAHPASSAYWENCLEPACADARELLNPC
jgi:hypothetical protein